MRETAREIAIQKPTETPIYQDQQQIVRGLGQHLTETYIGKVTGAGGAGGSLLNVPFEPVEIVAIQPGAPITMFHSVFAKGGAVHISTVLAVAVNATPPVITRVAEGNWTIALPIGMLADAAVATVVVRGCRDAAGSL